MIPPEGMVMLKAVLYTMIALPAVFLLAAVIARFRIVEIVLRLTHL